MKDDLPAVAWMPNDLFYPFLVRNPSTPDPMNDSWLVLDH
jgi:hypothetical protein